MNGQNRAGYPSILLISLWNDSDFETDYAMVLSKLRAQANVTKATATAQAGDELEKGPYQAVIATDPDILERSSSTLVSRLRAYVRTGGTLVLGFRIPAFGTSDRLATFFSSFGLHWRASAGTKRNLKINPAVEELALEGLPTEYPYTKQLYLIGMPREHAVYLTYYAPEDFDSEDEEDRDEFGLVVGEEQDSPVVFAPVDRGYLGFVGDMGWDDEMAKAVLVMCGLDPRW